MRGLLGCFWIVLFIVIGAFTCAEMIDDSHDKEMIGGIGVVVASLAGYTLGRWSKGGKANGMPEPPPRADDMHLIMQLQDRTHVYDKRIAVLETILMERHPGRAQDEPLR